MGKNRINIITLLWKGDFRGRDYTDQDVWNLYKSVSKWIDRPFEMYCLTNDMQADVPGKKIELIHNWPGWWSKVELFRPDLPCGRTLYLDLDTYIVSSLQSILDTEGDLVMFPSPYDKPPKDTGEGMRIFTYQAGTMLFTPGSLSWVYNKFRAHAQKWMIEYRSEQDIYAVWLPNQSIFSSEWLMKIGEYKKIGRTRENTIIITGNKDGEFRNLNINQ